MMPLEDSLASKDGSLSPSPVAALFQVVTPKSYSLTLHVPVYPHWGGGYCFASIPLSEFRDGAHQNGSSVVRSESVFEKRSSGQKEVPVELRNSLRCRLEVMMNTYVCEVIRGVVSSVDILLESDRSFALAAAGSMGHEPEALYLSPPNGMIETARRKLCKTVNSDTFEICFIFYEERKK